MSRDTQWHNYFMDIAELTGKLSYAQKMQVGAVAVRERRILCTGYNGTPPGGDNKCEDWDVNKMKFITRPEVEHAERNLIYFAARNGLSLQGASLYITHTPCVECARGILLAGFTEVYYRVLHKNCGINFLAENNLKSTQV